MRSSEYGEGRGLRTLKERIVKRKAAKSTRLQELLNLANGKRKIAGRL